MPALEKEIIQHMLQSKSISFPIFVETGTYMGETIKMAESIFDKLYTIEIKEEFYNSAKSNYFGSKI